MAFKFHVPVATWIPACIVLLLATPALAQDSQDTQPAPANRDPAPTLPDNAADAPPGPATETTPAAPVATAPGTTSNTSLGGPQAAPSLGVAPTDASTQPSDPPSQQTRFVDGKWHLIIATELGAMAITGSDIYRFGLGGSVIVGMQRNAWSLEALLLGSYSLQAKGALNAAYTDGSGRLFGIMARRRWADLPVSFAGGIGGSRLPVLRSSSADATAGGETPMIRAVATEQLGLLTSGRVELVRGRRGNLYVDARVFVPLLSAIAPTHYQPTGPTVGTTTPVRTSAQDSPGFAMTLGLGFEILFGE